MKIITALAVIALAVAGCGSSNSSSTSASSSPSAAASGGGGGAYGSSSSSKTTAAVSNSSGSKTSVDMYDDYFQPKVISGKPGSTVTVDLKNEGTKEHNFQITGQKKADADVPPGKTGTATVTIPKSGTVQFFCEYHKGLGMVGTVKAT
jgi:plastocyanin